MTEQLRINNIPILSFSSKTNDDFPNVFIKNTSSSQIFNMDIYVFMTESNESYHIDDFIENNVKKGMVEFANRIKKKELFDDDGTWCVMDRGFYNYVPEKSFITIPIDYPLDKDFFFLFIQYMDVLGNNYYTHLAFHRMINNPDEYQVDIINPIIPTLIDRIDFQDEDSRRVMIENEKVQEVIELYETSIYSLWLNDREIFFPDFRWGKPRLLENIDTNVFG